MYQVATGKYSVEMLRRSSKQSAAVMDDLANTCDVLTVIDRAMLRDAVQPESALGVAAVQCAFLCRRGGVRRPCPGLRQAASNKHEATPGCALPITL